MSLADRQVVDFERNLRTVISRFQAEIIEKARTGEMFAKTAELRTIYAIDLYDEILKALQDSGYYQAVVDLIDRDAELIRAVRAARKAAGLPTKFSKTSVNALTALRDMEYAQFDNIGKGFVASLSQELTNYIVSGIDQREFIMAIRSALDKQFARYAKTYAITSRAQFIQAVQDQAAASYDGELYWEYVGPEDDRMRDACIDGMAKRFFTDAERSEFEAENAAERAWNCRHTFQQITKKDYMEATNG